jgi:crotonobetaine/carnitine-CoA ligase
VTRVDPTAGPAGDLVTCERDEVLPARITAIAAADPHRPFASDVGGRSLTYAGFHDEMLRWCAYLRSLGLRPGDRVASLLPSSVDANLLWLAAACVGVLEVAVDRDLSGEFLRHVLSDAGVRWCFTRPEDAAVPASSGVEGLTVVIVERDGSLVDGFPADPLPGLPGPADVASVIYTSGTTGPAKGVMVTWAQFATAVGRIPRSWLSERDVQYSPWPMFHVSGRTPALTMADVGGRIVCRERPSVSGFWEDVDAYGCTVAVVSPIAPLLLAAPASPADREHPLRVVHLRGAPAVEFERRFGVRAVTSYGSTEMGFVLVKQDAAAETADLAGWLRPGYAARIVDPTGRDVAPGTVGELWVRPPAREFLMRGYLGAPEATDRAVVEGWYRTGDAFCAEEGGGLRFVDRIADTIRRFGENISPTAVEAVVAQVPGVLECAVVGLPSPVAGQEILVAVVPTGGGLTAESLYDTLAARLPRHMRPAYVAVLDDLPKTPSGKVRRRQVAGRAEGRALRTPHAVASRAAGTR